MFISLKQFHHDYFFYCNPKVQIMALQYMPVVGFMLKAQKVASKHLGLPMRTLGDFTVPEFHSQLEFIRVWFSNLICSLSHPDLFYFHLGIKYLKIINHFNEFKYNFFLSSGMAERMGEVEMNVSLEEEVPEVQLRRRRVVEKKSEMQVVVHKSSSSTPK